ncbi:large ribosomal subunit protein bL9m [Myripristis murdjan]|uniref:Large ribosomal subunit protein bL9m n=1 Tax=Myripristis murdjan TaxID=586833 RepID=A0A667WPK4_9TELE|nr:39S ribosomal protein L9, mitochondrial [Myripristis murdjan]
MWSCGRRVLQELLSQPPARCLSQTAVKNTVVVERWWQVPLSKVGSPPRLHPRRHRIYKLVENTAHSPKQKMELILTQTVEKLGGRGDTVFVRKSVGRNKLLPQGLAVYPSPENKQIFAEELKRLREGTLEERVQTRTGQLTVEYLKRLKLTIDDIPSADVVLTKEIVCRQILKRFRIVVPPHALRLPDEPIKSFGDYWCEITVNGIDTVRIPMSLAPYQDPSASFQKILKKQKKEQGEAATPAGEEEEEAVLKAVSEAAGEPEAEKEAATSLASSAAAGASAAAPDAAEAPQTSQDTSAPPSDTPKKD